MLSTGPPNCKQSFARAGSAEHGDEVYSLSSPLPYPTLPYHARAPQERKGGPQPALRVVSFGADRANRGPAFDMDLPELLALDGGPIAYEDARAYFRADPAHRRARAARGGQPILPAP